MNTAALRHNETPSYCTMFSMKYLSYLANPKILLSVILLDISGIVPFVKKYIFSDFTFLKFLAVAVIVDLITGIWKVILTEGIKKVTSKQMRVGTISKVVSYTSFIILIHVLTHFEINGIAANTYLWLNKIAYEFLILVEVKSIYENIIKINPKLDLVDPVIQKLANVLKPQKHGNN
jgi:hypothetical protein